MEKKFPTHDMNHAKRLKRGKNLPNSELDIFLGTFESRIVRHAVERQNDGAQAIPLTFLPDMLDTTELLRIHFVPMILKNKIGIE